METRQSEASQNYITVIPVEYPRSRVYPQPPEYIVDQYSEYVRERTREEYGRGDYSIGSEPQFEDVGPLYTVTQRFERDKSYGSSSHDVDRDCEWERPLHSLMSAGSSETSHQTKDSSTEFHADDQRPAQVSPPQHITHIIQDVPKLQEVIHHEK